MNAIFDKMFNNANKIGVKKTESSDRTPTRCTKTRILDQNQVFAAFEASQLGDEEEENKINKKSGKEHNDDNKNDRNSNISSNENNHNSNESDNDINYFENHYDILSTSSAYQDPNGLQRLFIPTNNHLKNSNSSFISLNPSVHKTDGDQISSFKKINKNGIEILEKNIGPGKSFCEKVLTRGAYV